MTDTPRQFINIKLTKAETVEMLKLLNRSLNTLEPKDWPSWTDDLLKYLEDFVK